ncbi:Hint domain-containing protein [Dactylosporangium sp. NPDC000555]|uniref:Hint domain-containing protein n=1 Tax=Dactylosporangium sp. NPDC000555 TaxID=3154260 RepID=UPI0033234F1A
MKADDVAEQAAKHGDDVGKAADDIPTNADDASEAVADAGKAECNSLLPGTPVLMADGSTKAIETLRVGDEVLATDPQTGTTESKPVTTTIEGAGDKTLIKVTVDIDGDAGDRTATFTATDHHPIWIASESQWRDAVNVPSGDLLLPPGRLRSRVARR